jgi:hypothetical protein
MNNWSRFWERLIVEKFCQKEKIESKIKKDLIAGGIDSLSEYLNEKRVVFIFSGVENVLNRTSVVDVDSGDWFLSLPSSMNELKRDNIGVIIFVHENYVRSVIRQNSGQRLAAYQKYSLCIENGDL